MRLGQTVAVGGLCLLLVGGCTDTSHDSKSSGAGSPSSSSSARDVDDLWVEAVLKNGVIVRATVHPIERADDHVVLTVDYSFSKDSPSTPRINISRINTTVETTTQNTRIRLVDLPGGRAWEAGWVANNESATTQKVQYLEQRDQTVTNVTFFGPVDVDAVDVMLPQLGLVKGVPVVEGGPETADLTSLKVSKNAVRYEQPFMLESLVRAYDGSAAAQKRGDTQTVVMASDVLFASDVAELSPEAGARVDEVAEQIAQVADGGEVRVVGHTDDVDTEEYNLDLSRRRAASVGDRMSRALGSSFTVTKDGKGESEPAMEGTDAVARAANRRVEIEFTAPEAVALPNPSADIPAATGPVATGHHPVTYTVTGVAGDKNDYTVEVQSIVRRDGYLVGTLVVTDESGVSENNEYFLSERESHSGEAELNYLWLGFHSSKNVTLMGPRGRVFPSRYHLTNGTDVSLLADSSLFGNIMDAAGYSGKYTIVWPDTGEDSVTVDSPNRFRITDIQVEEG